MILHLIKLKILYGVSTDHELFMRTVTATTQRR